MYFGYLTGSRGSNAQGFAGQVQRAMGLDKEFETEVVLLMALNKDMNLEQVATANEQFLTERMMELDSYENTFKDSKISVGRLVATGIFTGLSLIAPSLAGFNLYAISKLLGGIGGKIDAKIQNKFLATKNVMMRDASQIDNEKQEVEMGKKPITSPSEDISPENPPIVSNMLSLEHASVEEAVVAGGSYSNFMTFGEFRGGRPITHHEVIQDAINEEIRMKGLLISESLKQIEALDGGIVAQGDLEQTLLAIRAEDKLNTRKFGEIAKVLTKYYEAIYTEKSLSEIVGIYDASAYHILGYISRKFDNKEMLNTFEEDVLDLIIDIMKAAQCSSENIYTGLFSRQTWDKTMKSKRITSGVAPFYKMFLSKVAKTLYRNGLIGADPDTSLITSVQEFTIAIGKKKIDLWEKISTRRNGRLFGASEDLLSDIYVSLENLILSGLPESASYDVITTLQKDFDFLRFVQGDLSKNKFYDEARLLIYKIKDIISGATIPNYAGTVTSLNDDVLIGVDSGKFYGDLKDAKGPPSLDVIESLTSSIIRNLGLYITSTQLNKILDLVNNFKSSVVSYHVGTDLLSTYKDGYRKAFISDLINSRITPILQESPSMKSLSYLLFGDRSNRNDLHYGFFKNNGDDIYDLISLPVLRHIRMRVSSWNINDFCSEGLLIGQNLIDSLKTEITSKIDKFISGEKIYEYFLEGQVSVVQSLNYLNKRYIVSGYESEEALVQAYHHAVTVFTGTPRISNKWLGKMIGSSGLYQAQRGRHFSIKTLRKMVTFLEMIIRDDTVASIPSIDPQYVFMSQLALEQRQKIYEDAKKTIENYMFEHSIDRPNNWPYESTKAHHILSLLKRNLGFDLLGFKTLEKDIFIKSKGKFNSFVRHHFRNAFFRKLSNYVQDIVLTSSLDHVKYESYSEAEMLVIIKGFDKMMQMRGSGIDGAITKSDVINIFTGDEWVLNGPDGNGGIDKDQGWFFSTEGFDKMLTEFNKRKDLLQNKGLDQFLIEKYSTVYERFYLNFPHGTGMNIANADGFYSLVTPHPTLGDFAMGMNFDSGFLYPEY